MTESTISLGQLLNSLIQSTYHDLSLLSELLPTKQDTERKIKLAHFAQKTNFQFCRLLAIAYWASSRGISERLEAFTTGLDGQSDIYIDTANFLCFQQNQELRHCGIPRYCIVSAIDILRTCNFNFLPTCIMNRLVSLPPLTRSEKFDTRDKLDQNLRLRLINLVPTLPQILTPHLKLSPRGCLRMHVPHEFDARLTLMMGYPATPWKLFQLDFLVRDVQSVEEKPLVLPYQEFHLRNLLQTRLFNQDADNLLSDAYYLLHSFSQSLQLYVLCRQLIHLTGHWGRQSFKVEEYIPGERLRIGYWYKTYSLQTNSSISVSASHAKPHLVYSHCESTPFSDSSSSTQSGLQKNSEIQYPGQLIVDDLIHSCIEDKCLHSLRTIQKCLEDKKWPFPVLLHTSPPSLIFSFGFDDIPNKLEVSKDPRNGQIKCIINDFSVSSNSTIYSLSSNEARSSKLQAQLDDLARALFENISLSAEFLTQFRAQFRLWYYEQQAIEMDMCVSYKLPLINEDVLPIPFLFKEKESRISSFYSRLFIQLHTPYHYLVIALSLDQTASNMGQIGESMYMMETRPVSLSFQQNSIAVNTKSRLEDGFNKNSYSFLSISHLFQLAPECGISFGSDSSYFLIDPLQKRRLQNFGTQFYLYSISNARTSDRKFLFNLLHKLDALVSILCLQSAFNHIGCKEHFLASVMNGSSYALVLTKPPCPNHVSKLVYNRFCEHLAFCRFHFIPQNKIWKVQLSFSSPLRVTSSPLISPAVKTVQQLNLNYNASNYGKSLCEKFSSDWFAILVIFRSLVEYSVYTEECELIRKCSKVRNYSYTRLSISFSSDDPDFYQESRLDITWNTRLHKFQIQFANSPFTFAKSGFEEVFNLNYSIPQLLCGLIKLFPLYKLLEQSKLSTKQFKIAYNNPAIISIAVKVGVDIEYYNFNTIILHIQKQDPTERVLHLLDKFIDSFGNPPSLPISAVSQARKFPISSLHSPPASSKPSPLLPTSSKSSHYFFPPNDSDNSIVPPSHPTKTINYFTLKSLLLPSNAKPHIPPLCTFLGAAYLLDYERLVKFGNLPNLDPSRIKLEPGSFCVQFDKVTVSIFLEPNFTDLGVKLSLNDTIDTHTTLRDAELQALVTFFHSSKIKSPVFSINALSCYLTLMNSSSSLIKSAAYIFKHSQNPLNEWLWRPELCLTVPDNPHCRTSGEISINPGISCLYKIPKGYMLYIRLLPQKQEHRTIVDLIMVYDFKQNIIDLKTYGISVGYTNDSIGNSIRKLLNRVNASRETDCSLMLAVKEISKHLVI